MNNTTLLHELVTASALRQPDRAALTFAGATMDYGTLADRVAAFAAGLVSLGLRPSERVAHLSRQARRDRHRSFGATAAGGVFVPLNPLLKPEQVAYILRDCNVRVLVTSPERLALLHEVARGMRRSAPRRRHVGAMPVPTTPRTIGRRAGTRCWRRRAAAGHRVIDTDMAAILYTSGSTGQPKGVVLSHRNMVAGAKSVASYLENNPDDTLLAALPLSFDAGFSQLTTAFHVGRAGRAAQLPAAARTC